MTGVLRALLATLLLVACTQPQAGETRPALLDIREALPGLYDFLWKTPAGAQGGLDIEPQMPAACHLRSDIEQQSTHDALLRRGRMQCTDGLSGKTIVIKGLDATVADVLVQVHHRDGHSESHLLRATVPQVTLGDGQPLLSYTRQGFSELLTGIDLLLLALGPMLLAPGRRSLVLVVAALGLVCATGLALRLPGYVPVAPLPLSAVQAFGVLYLGLEAVRQALGQDSFGQRHPGAMALALGIPLGLSLAGGLPASVSAGGETALMLSLYGFGVALALVMLALLVALFRHALREVQLHWLILVLPGYLLGGIGAYWTLKRMLTLVAAII
ncbi:hypothetical protein GCM10011348_35190 [Marinobacterium nitratireducens]|uniref:HupE / UreJ protein n=1 Tax=Marinobacterium nitratireducens TaxID=518897 RepID=A0A917ZMA0_9GAMM|nr:HupE/UreJ family protein [Marinobacterium nitratireducens]GGO85801.1 hypothetical protein GCM10011348_35190 [Marinobacterium nitratireducens]